MKIKLLILSFLLTITLSIFASGNRESHQSVLSKQWDPQFTDHPDHTVRDCIPSNGNLYFCSLSPLFSKRKEEKKRLIDEFLRQLSWNDTLNVKGELLDYEQGNLTFSKWYGVSLDIVNPASQPANWNEVLSVEDNFGSSSLFSTPGKLQLNSQLVSALKMSRQPFDFFDAVLKEENLRIAVGVTLRYADRDESWLAADKAALLELARAQESTMKVKSIVYSISESRLPASTERGSLVTIDTTVKGFYVLYRWFDENYFYSVAVCSR